MYFILGLDKKRLHFRNLGFIVYVCGENGIDTRRMEGGFGHLKS
jgi:hypothetical protein